MIRFSRRKKNDREAENFFTGHDMDEHGFVLGLHPKTGLIWTRLERKGNGDDNDVASSSSERWVFLAATSRLT